MTDSHDRLGETVSALMDGAFNAPECPGAVQQVLADPEGVRIWSRYHVVGDALRSAELVPAGDDHAFWEQLSRKLVQEAERPQWGVGSFEGPVVHKSPTDTTRGAANASVWNWKLLAGAGFSALVAVVASALWTQHAVPGGQQLAAQTAAQAPQNLAAVEGEAGVMLRDPYLDQLMAAHQQLGGHSALQAPSGFLRNATYQGPGR